MISEEEVRDYVHGKPREVDLDLILDAAKLANFRFEQIRRWRERPSISMFNDLRSMATDKVLARRRKESIRLLKEGTNVRRDAEAEEEDQSQ